WRWTEEDGGSSEQPNLGRPSFVLPPLPANRHSSPRFFRSTVARPSASSGQPPPRPHLLRPAGHLRTLGVAGASPAEKRSKEQRGCRGRPAPCWGSGGKAPGSRENRWIVIPPRISVVGQRARAESCGLPRPLPRNFVGSSFLRGF